MLTKREEYGRGWTVLLASAVGAGTGVAPLEAYSLGAFMVPLEQQFGWTRAQVTAAPFFKALAILLVSAAIGMVADRFGARRVALISQALLVVSIAGMAFITGNIWTFYAGYFLFSILGGGTLPMTWSRAVTGWFVRSRGLALGLSLTGTGIIGALLPSYIGWLVGEVGWRGAYVGLALLPLVLAMPLTLLFFKEPPNDRHVQPASALDQQPQSPRNDYTFGEAIRTVCFWQISLSFMLVAAAVTAVLVHAMPLLMDRGVERHTAAALAGLVGLAVTSGRLVSGYLLDAFRAPQVAFGLFILPAAACALLVLAGDNLFACGVAILLVGLAGGAEHDIAAYFSAKYFGRLHYGAIYGMLYALYSLGSGIGPSAVGKVHDRTGSYDAALYGGIALFAVSAALALTLRTPLTRSPSFAPAPAAKHAVVDEQ